MEEEVSESTLDHILSRCPTCGCKRGNEPEWLKCRDYWHGEESAEPVVGFAMRAGWAGMTLGNLPEGEGSATCPTCGSPYRTRLYLMDNGTYCNAPEKDPWHDVPEGWLWHDKHAEPPGHTTEPQEGDQ